MSDIKTNIDPRSQPEKDWGVVQKVEEAKLQKEKELAEARKKSPTTLLFGAFAVFTKKIFAFLTSARSRGQALLIDNIGDLIQYLSLLRDVLKQLSQEDQSFNPEFIQKLSDAWHSLLEAMSSLELIERKRREEIKAVKRFLETMRKFPPKEEHSLGFYLTEFAGREWLPFPFVELLHALHEEHQAAKDKSQLSSWIREIGSLIEILAPKAQP